MASESEEGPRSFARFIEQLADGEAHAVLSAQLHDLCRTLQAQVEAQGGRGAAKGEMTLKLRLTAEQNMVAIGYEVSDKRPKPSRSASVMWLTRGGNLTGQNPRQQELPGLREVITSQAPARDVGAPQTTREV